MTNNLKKKHILQADDETWKEVLRYKIDHDMKNNNETILELIKKGLSR